MKKIELDQKLKRRLLIESVLNIKFIIIFIVIVALLPYAIIDIKILAVCFLFLCLSVFRSDFLPIIILLKNDIAIDFVKSIHKNTTIEMTSKNKRKINTWYVITESNDNIQMIYHSDTPVIKEGDTIYIVKGSKNKLYGFKEFQNEDEEKFKLLINRGKKIITAFLIAISIINILNITFLIIVKNINKFHMSENTIRSNLITYNINSSVPSKK